MIQPKQEVSVIICTYTQNRWHELVAAVESVKRQTFLPKEIIVVVDHNPDLLQQVQECISCVIVVDNTMQRGLSGARNCGVAMTTGKIIAFLDDDAVATPNWLMLLSRMFTHPDVIGVGGAIDPLWLSSKPSWFPEEFFWIVGCTYRGLPQTVAAVRNPIGANMSIRREVFDFIGGFRSEIGRVGTHPVGCEETELCIRARQRWPQGSFLYQPDAHVFHCVPSNRATWKYFRSRCYAEGHSKAIVAQFVGAKDGLSSERAYTLQTLPLGMLRGVRDGFLRHNPAGFLRAGAIMIGLLITAVGYFVGMVSHLVLTKADPKSSIIHTTHINTYK